MKIVILATLVVVALADNFDMKFEEGGKKFVEKIKVDVAAGVEEIQVPKHMDRVAVDILKDFKQGLSAKKMLQKKVCYISKLGRDDEPPKHMELSMKLARSKFPSDRYTVINKNYLPLREMSVAEVGEKIAAHCQGLQMIFTAIYENEDISAEVTKMIRASKLAGKSKRDVTVQTFTACRDDSTNIVETCPQDKLSSQCRFARNDGKDCVYQINCKLGDNGFLCKGTHVFNSPICCDFVCSN